MGQAFIRGVALSVGLMTWSTAFPMGFEPTFSHSTGGRVHRTTSRKRELWKGGVGETYCRSSERAPVTATRVAEAGIEPAQASFRATCSYQQERLRSESAPPRGTSATLPVEAWESGSGTCHPEFGFFPGAGRRGGVPRKIGQQVPTEAVKEGIEHSKSSDEVTFLYPPTTSPENQSAWPDSNRRFRAPEARGVPGFPTR